MKTYITSSLLALALITISLPFAQAELQETESESAELFPVEINFSKKPGIHAASYLAGKGIIVDKSENELEYNIFSNITRREMLKVMMNISGDPVEDTCNGVFEDLDASDFGCKYAEAAVSNGYISQNVLFRPNDNVTQAEGLKMIMQARGIPRDENDDWRAGYSSKALDLELIDYEINGKDRFAQRRYVFLTAARTYEEFQQQELEKISEVSDVFSTIGVRSRFSTLARLLEAAGDLTFLTGDGPYTFFAPTDYAFSMLPEETVERLLLEENRRILSSIIAYHFVDGNYKKNTLNKGIDIQAVNGDDLIISQYNGEIIINDISTIKSDEILATNGIIYRVDRVIVPVSIDIETLDYKKTPLGLFLEASGEGGEVYITIENMLNGEAYGVTQTESFKKIEASEFSGYDIPTQAQIAFTTLFQEESYVYYVVQDDNILTVMRSEIDGNYNYEIFESIEL